MAIWLHMDQDGGIGFSTKRPDSKYKSLQVAQVKIDGKLCPIIETLARTDTEQLDDLFDGIEKLVSKAKRHLR